MIDSKVCFFSTGQTPALLLFHEGIPLSVCKPLVTVFDPDPPRVSVSFFVFPMFPFPIASTLVCKFSVLLSVLLLAKSCFFRVLSLPFVTLFWISGSPFSVISPNAIYASSVFVSLCSPAFSTWFAHGINKNPLFGCQFLLRNEPSKGFCNQNYKAFIRFVASELYHRE